MTPSLAEQFSGFLVENRIVLTFLAVVVSLVLFPLIEAGRPLKPQAAATMRHRWRTNLSLMVINQFNVSFIASAATVFSAWWAAEKEIGLLTRLDIGFWTATLLTLLSFELISYTYHRLLHTIPLLWRIHAVHHCDTEIDFTTTFRNHPLELLVVVPVSMPLVVLLGPPAASVVFYQIIRSLVLVFAHTNFRLPQRLDRVLRLVITTPDFHRLHHSNDRHYTDSNFCPTFPIFDYLFGTANKVSQERLPGMELGLEYLTTPRQTGLINQLLLPFIWKTHSIMGPNHGVIRVR